jgi:hypothetical protein
MEGSCHRDVIGHGDSHAVINAALEDLPPVRIVADENQRVIVEAPLATVNAMLASAFTAMP